MKLEKVTISGADDLISPKDLTKISQQYPFVEWAILLSYSQKGNNRYPSKDWMNELVKEADNLNLAGHLCGKWMRDLIKNGNVSFISEIPIWDNLKRIQLNFAKQPIELSWDCIEQLRKFCWKDKKQFIIQMDGINNEILSKLMNAGVLSFGLFDLSGGTGVLPEEWPERIPGIVSDAYRGYAGGLNPDNIKEELIKMNESCKDSILWIDMESGVRTNDIFDLEKVVKCLEIAKEWI